MCERLVRIKRWLRDRLFEHNVVCLVSYRADHAHIYHLLDDEHVWLNAITIDARSPAEASTVMGVLVREMRTYGIARWMTMHRDFTVNSRVVLKAGDVVRFDGIAAYRDRLSAFVERDGEGDNYGAW